MRWSPLLAASLSALPSLIEAHDGMPLPKLVGRRSVSNLKARNAFGEKKRSAAPEPAPQPAPVAGPKLQARQNTNGPCGAGIGSCAAGYCCSPAGNCGLGPDFCAAPYAQFNYGSGADANQVPPGPVTSNVARTKVGSVPYGGVGINDCVEPGVIALTFDDGPYIYTGQVLDVLQKYNVTATFFITGNNNGKGQIGNVNTGYPAIIQRMHAAGHQIASHTWSHQDLGSSAATQGMDTLTRAQRLNQMYYNEIAFNDILGFFPTYMRPPFSDCDSKSGCEADMATLGYHVVYFDLDTEDYLLDDPNLIQQAKNDFVGNITSQNAADGADWLVIAHDIHYQTAYNLTEYMVTTLLQYGYKPVTVGECLGDPAANWYRTLGGGAPYTSAVSSTASSSSTSSTSSTSTKTTTTSTKSTTTSTSTKTTTTSTSTKTTSTSTSTKSTSTSTSTKTTTTTKSTSTTTKTTSTSTKTTSSSGPSATAVSPDATCGGTNGYTCQGSAFGNCCSQNGWCGSTSAYCGGGCQSKYGTCTTGQQISNDGSCGGTNGYTCAGSTFGNCCSVNGWCGSTSAYCGTGCQTAFGTGCT